jgi:squalene synthase HpnC
MEMPPDWFQQDLEQYGPHGAGRAASLDKARAYCRRLARRHYENFTVASWLLPRNLRQHMANVYAYCRWSDHLADEIECADESLRLLDWWERELEACSAGRAVHPVFVALGETLREFDMPAQPLHDLLVAFRQDQHKTRYETFEELSRYCRYSANPVGRMVLFLSRAHNPQTVPLADSICTGLQLANFWQDVARDFDRGRIYVPAETMHAFGYSEDRFATRQADAEFRRMLRHEVDRAESYLVAGRPLETMVPANIRVDVALFVEGGLAVLNAIRRIGCDVWTKRPTVGKLQKLKLLASTWWRTRARRQVAIER